GVVSPGYVGDGMLKIHNNDAVWSFASQSIALNGVKAHSIKVSAFVKIQDVGQGTRPWQQARLNIEFKDQDGKRLGGWPIVGSFVGTFDWKKLEKEFSVPRGTKRVDMFVGLMEVPGTIWADEIRIDAFDKKENHIPRTGSFITDTSNWFEFQAPKPNKGGTATDVSFLLDPPAGKHGFMKVKDGHFYFADGTRAKFWGANLYAPDIFVEHEKAEEIAERLARYGCNLVRIHHLDAFWANPNIFDPDKNDTQHFSKKSLDQLDYFIYALKKRGIYVFMDLLVDRQFKEEDKVADWQKVKRGAKISGFYNRRIIELQKQYAKKLLLHYNPYTKKRYVDEPAIASYKLINEAMLFYISTMFDVSPYYLKELDGLWNKWLIKTYGSRSKLVTAWTDKYNRCDLAEDENPALGNVRRGDTLLKFQRGGYEKIERMRDMDTMRFYAGLQESYYKEMAAYLKKLGTRVPLSGSNHWINVAADVKTNAVLDYVDRHRYWDHPKYGYGTNIVFEDLPMVKYPKEALPNNFAFYRVADMPYVISEWNSCFPNEYRHEAPLMMASYALLQDWDAVIQFSYNGKEWGSLMKDNFDTSTWPNVFGQWPAAALLFYRGDASEAKNVLEETLGPNQLYGPIFEDDPIAGEALLPLISKTQIRFADKKKPFDPDPLLEKFHDEKEKTIISDTGELVWDYGQGIFSIETDRTQALVGFIGDKKLTLKNLSVSSRTPFVALCLSSLSEQPINKAPRLLLTAASRIENRGQKYNAVKTQLKQLGYTPIMMEGVSANIVISTKLKPKKVSVFALDMNGNRIKEIAAQTFGQSIGFTIEPKDKAMFYEIILK
ncbi:MAG: beta-galactosidase, partial [Candidatus Saganbacteria bacterium]|nr:beta-galactosidase [Candidatus Saganbacteria bacterium]